MSKVCTAGLILSAIHRSPKGALIASCRCQRHVANFQIFWVSGCLIKTEILFFVQSFISSQTIYLYRGYLSIKIFVFIIFILLSFGILVEVQQLYIPFRTFDYYDLITNLIGVVSGVFCVKFFNK